jgi:hypothetical protein
MVGLDAVNAEVFDGCDVADWYLADVQGPSAMSDIGVRRDFD